MPDYSSSKAANDQIFKSFDRNREKNYHETNTEQIVTEDLVLQSSERNVYRSLCYLAVRPDK